MNSVRVSRHRGFTVVEIMVVIAVIGILAVIGTIAYQGFQQRAKESLIMNDLGNVATIFEQYALKNKGEFPDEEYLRTHLTASKGVTFAAWVNESLPIYIGLSPVQNGALFYTICNNLVAENFGRGIDLSGAVAPYINGNCNVYNNNQIQVNSSWGGGGAEGRDISTPVSNTTLSNIVAAISSSAAGDYNNPYFPDRKAVEMEFFQTWQDRFLAQGGTYPISSFWDGDWCSPGQPWCTPFEPLSDPVPLANQDSYCVAAAYEGLEGTIYHISSEKNVPQPGNCS